MQPIFSFIIPTFNRADIICEALESVRLEQINSGFCVEVLVADDYSSDASEKIIKNWCAKENVTWLSYEKLPQKLGVCAARNNGVNRAKGELLIFLDSDDQIMPGALKHIKSVFDKQQNVDVYYGAIQKKSGSKGVLPKRDALENPLTFQAYIALRGVGEYLQVCRSALLADKAFRFSESINGFETYLWMKVLRAGAKLWIDPRPVRLYDDLRTDRLCHPANLGNDAKRLALGFQLFFKEFGDAIAQVDFVYWSSLLLRVIFYSKAADVWNAQLKQSLREALKIAPLKVKLIVLLPNCFVRFAYPFINTFRANKYLQRLK